MVQRSGLSLVFLLNHPRRSHPPTITSCPKLTRLPIDTDRPRREVAQCCSFEAGSVYLLALVFPCADICLVSMDRNPPVPTPADSEETCRRSYTPRLIPVGPPKAQPLVFSLILVYMRQGMTRKLPTYKLKCPGVWAAKRYVSPAYEESCTHHK